MMRTRFLFLAVISLVLSACLATAATRPRYGGTLTVETGARVASLDPSRLPADPASRSLAEKILFLAGDRLFRLDDRGVLHPSLSTRVVSVRRDRVWTFQLRDDVKFSDGRPLRAVDVVHSLGARHPDWHIAAFGDRVRITLPRPMRDLPLQLALAENSILRRDGNGLPIGTGPFHVADFSTSEITLAATENGWRPRPFLDGVKILMGRAPREQWIDFQLGRADLVELSPGQVRQAEAGHAHVWSSKPAEVVALVFRQGSSVAEDVRVRQALAAAVNRTALVDVLLQKQGETAELLLPQWLSGYAFLAPPPATAPAPAAALPPVTLSYDSSDSLLASFAARIAVDARAAGLTLHLAPAAGDVQLVRERFGSLDPAQALKEMLASIGLSGKVAPSIVDEPTNLHDAEQSLVTSAWVIPLVELPEFYAVGARVEDWNPLAISLAGGWRLEDVWKEPE